VSQVVTKLFDLLFAQNIRFLGNGSPVHIGSDPSIFSFCSPQRLEMATPRDFR
jgi:hypothetical protein